MVRVRVRVKFKVRVRVEFKVRVRIKFKVRVRVRIVVSSIRRRGRVSTNSEKKEKEAQSCRF